MVKREHLPCSANHNNILNAFVSGLFFFFFFKWSHYAPRCMNNAPPQCRKLQRVLFRLFSFFFLPLFCFERIHHLQQHKRTVRDLRSLKNKEVGTLGTQRVKESSLWCGHIQHFCALILHEVGQWFMLGNWKKKKNKGKTEQKKTQNETEKRQSL